MRSRGEQDLCYSLHQGRLWGLGGWGRKGLGLVEMGTGNKSLGRASQGNGQGKGKGPRGLEMEEQTQGRLVVFFIWKVPFRR